MANDLTLSRENVAKARADTSGRVYRVYCDGIFDLFHIGHMRMLEQAKKALGDPSKTYLLVGVCSDELTHKYKGKTVLNHEIRCESVRHCKWVDEVIPDAPWVIDEEFLNRYQIDFVAHDALPYVDTSGASPDGDCYSLVKRLGKFLETQRTEGISTSDIIVAIVRDYDAYVERNLSRGYTKEELGVGRTWEVRRVVHRKEKQLKQSVEKTKSEWRDLSETARAFVKSFQPEGRRFNRMYVKRLRQELPQRTEGVLYHAWGLTRAVFATCLYVASFFNVFSYCTACRRSKKQKE